MTYYMNASSTSGQGASRSKKGKTIAKLNEVLSLFVGQDRPFPHLPPAVNAPD